MEYSPPFIPTRTLIIPGADRPVPGGVALEWTGPCVGFGPNYTHVIAIDAHESGRGDWYVQFYPVDADGSYDAEFTLFCPVGTFLVAVGMAG